MKNLSKGSDSMEKVLKKVQDSKFFSVALRLTSHAATAFSVIVFVYLAIISAKESLLCLAELAFVLGVPFLAVSALRRVINAPRPYELYDFYGEPPKKKRGCSFPSRHAYSVFAIGTAACLASPLLGAVLLIFGVLLCTARVLLGIHFIRDVLAGAAIGVVSALIGALIISPF